MPARDYEDVATVLVTVKAYPAIGKKNGEAVCVAGVRLDTDTPEWIRLFPVGFRDLPADKKFDKYQVVRLKVARPTSDRRPESRTPDLGSLALGEQLGTEKGWAARAALMSPLIAATTTCELLAGAKREGGSAPSLGLIKPKVLGFTVEANPDYRPISDGPVTVDLFGHQKDLLEQSPVIAKFRYKCESRGCKGHGQSLIDWESGQLARRNRGRGVEEMLRLHRERFLDEICGPGGDTHFYVGNMHQHPTDFLVLGVWWPAGTASRQGLLELEP